MNIQQIITKCDNCHVEWIQGTFGSCIKGAHLFQEVRKGILEEKCGAKRLLR
jgi:hypothetical protein